MALLFDLLFGPDGEPRLRGEGGREDVGRIFPVLEKRELFAGAGIEYERITGRRRVGRKVRAAGEQRGRPRQLDMRRCDRLVVR